MPNWKPIVGLSFKADQFDFNCHTMNNLATSWKN